MWRKAISLAAALLMALSVFVDAFNAGTGALGSTIVRTGVGFQPKAIIFWWTGRSDAVDALGRARYNAGYGFGVSATDRRAIGAMSDNAVASADQHVCQSNAAVIITNTPGTTVIDGAIDVQSMDADGYTLVVDDVMPVDLRVHALCLGGADLTNAETLQFAEPAATGNQEVTTGFQADIAFFMSIALAGTPPNSNQTLAHLSFGVAKSSTNRWVIHGACDDGSPSMDTQGYGFDGECIALVSNTVGEVLDARADLVSFNAAPSFTVNWLERAGSRLVHVLLLKGGSYRVGNLLTLTSLADIVETGFGFQPRGGLFVSACRAKSTQDTPTGTHELSAGAFSSTTVRGAQGLIDVDATANAQVSTAVEHDEVYVNVNSAAAPAIEGLMDIKTIGADGWTLTMDDADPTANFVGSVAFGDVAGGTTFFQSLPAVAVGVAVMSDAVIFPAALAAIAVGLPVLSRVVTYARTLAATAIGVATLTKGMFVTMAATALGVAGLTKGMFKTLAATATGVPTLATALLTSVTMAATAVGVAALSKVLVFGQTLVAVATGVAGMVTEFIAGSGSGEDSYVSKAFVSAGRAFRALSKKWYRTSS